ncbi:hypothetical protein D3C72_755770 [compost metagenome]
MAQDAQELILELVGELERLDLLGDAPLGRALLGDVFDHADGVHHAARLVFEEVGRQLARKGLAVLAPVLRQGADGGVRGALGAEGPGHMAVLVGVGVQEGGRLPDRLLGRVAEGGRERRVHIQNDSLGIRHHDRVLVRLEQRAVAGLAGAERLDHAPALGDVARDGVDQPVFVGGGPLQQAVVPRAGAVAVLEVEGLDALAEPAELGGGARRVVGVEQVREGAAHDLVGLVAENGRESRVDLLDPPVRAAAQHQIERQAEKPVPLAPARLEPPVGLGQRPLEPSDCVDLVHTLPPDGVPSPIYQVAGDAASASGPAPGGV